MSVLRPFRWFIAPVEVELPRVIVIFFVLWGFILIVEYIAAFVSWLS